MSSFTSFRKKNTTDNTDNTTTNNHNPPPGTRTYASSVPGLMTSCGMPALDSLLGPGGIPLGTLTIIKEDRLTGYAKLLLDYVIAQGLSCGHAVCHVAASSTSNGITGLSTSNSDIGVNHVMGVAENRHIDDNDENDDVVNQQQADQSIGGNDAAASTAAATAERMKIGWRYESMPKVDSSPSQPTFTPGSSGIPYQRVFDLTKTYSPTVIQEMTSDGRIVLIDAKEFVKTSYDALFEEISRVVDAYKKSTQPNVLRLVIRSLASPLWYSGDEDYPTVLYRFLIKLKSLLRPLHAICFISIPAHLYGDSLTSPSSFIRRLEWAADAVLEVESFAGSARSLPPIITSTYHGLVHPHKQLTYHPDSKLSTFAFKCRRRKFDISIFYIPPEEGGTDRPEEVASASSSGTMKQKKMKKKFDVEDDGGRDTLATGSKSVRFAGKIDF
ncbi:hypothetical protein SmJEL517_g01868 [Synchytrium microbalum]|uniref:Elongator complex protein 4 n=1 Tax=Synchytrium microbalum TaxID=1806994 RepID=A0A507CCE0_9FUNG|nr:uncharacterized protein SmJEL517_g01868 [Synchytrium microbalum]TPX35696.1 hypothetical protein SmJEL517_g01868 [Synchytrium microbalum]